MRDGLAAYRATGAELWRPRHLSLLAEAYWKGEQTEEGLRVLAEALALVDTTGERYYEAELYRLKGELTLQQASQKSKGKKQKSKASNPKSQILDPLSEAEACFLKAIEVARKQYAKSFELRAAMSLVRLRHHQAQDHAPRNTHREARIRLDEAYVMLSEVYDWFTEGFETKDLQEAKELLAELTRA
jgi:predicted ATPase